MFFFIVGEYSFNRLGAKRVDRLAMGRMSDVLGLLKVVLPDMPGDSLDTLLVLCASLPDWTVLADIALALVFPVSFAVGCGIFKHLVLRTKRAVVVLVVDILIPWQITILDYGTLVGQRSPAEKQDDRSSCPTSHRLSAQLLIT